MSGVDPGMLQTALLQVAEATKANCLERRKVLQVHSASRSSGSGVDWSKLINKSRLCLNLHQWNRKSKLFDDPSNGFDMSTASSETRLRTSKRMGY